MPPRLVNAELWRLRRITIGVMSCVFGVVALLVGPELLTDLFQFNVVGRAVVSIVGASVLVTGTFVLLQTYLLWGTRWSSNVELRSEPTSTVASDNHVLLDELANLETRVKQVERSFSEVAGVLDTTERSRIIAEAVSEIKGHIPEALRLEFEERYSASAIDAERAARLDQVTEWTKARLKAEIALLGRRSATSLSIGAIATTGALTLLAVMAFSAELKDPDWMSLLAKYVPRLSLAIFIEVFAFFFLRLYRTTLSEVKFYQNELTTVEQRTVAMEAAQLRTVSASMAGVVDRLARTDRNGAPDLNDAARPVDVGAVGDVLERVAKILTRGDN